MASVSQSERILLVVDQRLPREQMHAVGRSGRSIDADVSLVLPFRTTYIVLFMKFVLPALYKN